MKTFVAYDSKDFYILQSVQRDKAMTFEYQSTVVATVSQSLVSLDIRI